MQPAGMLLQAMIEIDGRQLQVQMDCNIDKEQGIFLLPIKIIEEEAGEKRIIASGELKISIVNPITITAIVLYAATVFGFCMIQHMAVPTYELFVQSYEDTKRLDSDQTLGTRVRNLFRRVKENINSIIEPTRRAVAPCAGQGAKDVVMRLL